MKIAKKLRTVHFIFTLLLTTNVLWAQVNVNTATFVQQKDIFTDVSNPSGMSLSSDGTKMFVCGFSFGGEDVVYAFDLSTAYDVSTAVRNSGETLSLGDGVNFSISPTDMQFRSDGMQLFIIATHTDLNTFAQEQKVYSYDLTTAFDLQTASATAGAEFSVNADEDFTSGIELNNDGTKFFIIGKTNDKVIEYNMSIAYDVTSAVKGEEFSVSSQAEDPASMRFNEDGTGLAVVNVDFPNSSVNVYDYVLSTPYNLTTISYAGVSSDLSIDFNSIRPTAMAFGNSGTKFYLAGTDNTGAPVREYDLAIDNEPPTVLITTSETGPANTSPIPVTITFSEEVTGFAPEDLTVGNGTASTPASTDNITFTSTITPAGDGSVTVDIAAAVAQDLAGNDNTVAAQFSIDYDATAPTVAITSSETGSTNSTPIPVTITFSEEVTGLASGDLTVGNGTASTPASTDNITFTSTITPAGDGSVTVDIAAAVVQDLAGNDNTAATQFSIDYDATSSGVSIMSSISDPTNTSPIEVDIIFDEPVTGFDLSDVVIVNGDAPSLTVSSSNLYSVNVTPSADGEVTVSVAADVAQDAAGNGNEAAMPFSIDYDATAPTVVITSSETGPTNTSPIAVTITFSEDVTGFEVADLMVSGGTLDNFAGSGATYTVEITPSEDGTVTLDIAAALVQDAAGNENTVATQFSIDYDATAPTVSLQPEVTSEATLEPFQLLVLFSEEVTELVLGDIEVMNGVASELSGPTDFFGSKAYTATITPDGSGDITITIADNAVQDLAGNENLEVSTVITYDTTKPTLTISGAPAIINNSSFTVTFEFSEDVTGFVSADLSITNGTVGTIEPTDEQNYSAEITPNGEGNITISVPMNVVTDKAGNGNESVEEVVVPFDGVAPVLTINALTTNDATPELTGTVDDANVDVMIEIEGTEYPATNSETGVWTLADGTITTNLADGTYDIKVTATDAAGNEGTDDTSDELLIDATGPVVTITSLTTNDATPELTGTVTDALSTVTGVEVIVNGDTYDATIDGNTWTVLIVELDEGTYEVAVEATDALENIGTDASSNELVIDLTPPTVQIQASSSVPNLDAFSVTFTFSEEVTGFEATSVTVANGTLENLAGGNITFTADIRPSASLIEGDQITLNIDAGAASDEAGNENVAGSEAMTVVDLPYSGGTGTEADPYLIASEADLRLLSASSSDFNAHFKQTADITMGEEPFTPIGYYDDEAAIKHYPFSGSYNGNGYTIDRLSLGLVQVPDELSGTGLFGTATDAHFENIEVNVINNTESFVFRMVGGLIAVARQVQIQNCSVTGTISSSGPQAVGGLVGLIRSGEVTRIDNSFSDFKIPSSSVGAGLIGVVGGSVLVNNCYAKGDITGSNSIGGLVGLVEGSHQFSINSSYYAGRLEGEFSTSASNGGLIGLVENGAQVSIENSFWDKELSGVDTNVSPDGAEQVTGGIGLTTAEMKDPSTFIAAEWDFKCISSEETWDLDLDGINDGYPILSWQTDNESCVLILSTNEIPNGASIIYPSPTNGLITIQSEGKTSITDVEIFNMQGLSVLHREFTQPTKELNIDISDRQSGIYFVRILNGARISTHRVILQK